MKIYNAIMNLVCDLLSMMCLKDVHLAILFGKGVSGVCLNPGRQIISSFIH